MSSPAPGQCIILAWEQLVQNDVERVHSDLVGSEENQRKPKEVFLGMLSASPWLIPTQLLLVSPTAQPVPVLTSPACCRDDQCHLLAATNTTIVHSMLGAGISSRNEIPALHHGFSQVELPLNKDRGALPSSATLKCGSVKFKPNHL